MNKQIVNITKCGHHHSKLHGWNQYKCWWWQRDGKWERAGERLLTEFAKSFPGVILKMKKPNGDAVFCSPNKEIELKEYLKSDYEWRALQEITKTGASYRH